MAAKKKAPKAKTSPKTKPKPIAYKDAVSPGPKCLDCETSLVTAAKKPGRPPLRCESCAAKRDKAKRKEYRKNYTKKDRKKPKTYPVVRKPEARVAQPGDLVDTVLLRRMDMYIESKRRDLPVGARLTRDSLVRDLIGNFLTREGF
jgi:hypothetical protein